MVKCCARCIIYTFLCLFYVAIGIAGWVCFEHGNDVAKKAALGEKSDEWTYKGIAIAIWCLDALLLLVLCCACSRIETAIEMLQIGAKFILNNSCIIFVPIVWFLVFALWLTYWIWSSAYIFSIGDVYHKTGYAVGSIKWDPFTNFLFAINWFNFFWQTAIFLCSLYFVIVSTATLWYFEWHKDEHHGSLVSTSITWLFLHHFGSVAFSALLIAATWVLQLVMMAIIYMLKVEDKGGENQCAICLVKC